MRRHVVLTSLGQVRRRNLKDRPKGKKPATDSTEDSLRIRPDQLICFFPAETSRCVRGHGACVAARASHRLRLASCALAETAEHRRRHMTSLPSRKSSIFAPTATHWSRCPMCVQDASGQHVCAEEASQCKRVCTCYCENALCSSIEHSSSTAQALLKVCNDQQSSCMAAGRIVQAGRRARSRHAVGTQ